MFYKANIDKSNNIREYEETFIKLIPKISLLGQIDLNENQINNISEIMKDKIKILNTNPSYLKRKAPITTALFLLYTGIKDYQEGNFWGPVYKELELEEDNTRLHEKLGEVFYYTLEKYNLIKLDPGRNKYVNQILAHALIVNNYLQEYFEEFLYKECGDFLDFSFTIEDVEKRIVNIRKDHKGHKNLCEDISTLKNKTKNLRAKINDYQLALENHQQLIKINKLIKNRNNITEIDQLLELPSDFLEQKTNNLAAVEGEISNYKAKIMEIESIKKKSNELLKLQKEEQRKIKNLKNKKEKIQAKIREESSGIFDQELDLTVVKVIKNINFDELSIKLSNYKKYNNFKIDAETLKGIFSKIIFWFKNQYFILKGEKKKIKSDIQEILKDLPLKNHIYNELPSVFFTKLKSINDLILKKGNIENKVNKSKETNSTYQKKLEEKLSFLEPETGINYSFIEAELAKKAKIIEEKISALIYRKRSVLEEIKNYKMKLNIISGDKGIEIGKSILEEERKLRKKLNKLKKELDYQEHKLNNLLDIVSSKNKNEIKNLLIHLKSDLKSKKKKLKTDQKKLEAYPERLYSLIEPSRIFLFQAEDIAVDFVYKSLITLKKEKDNKSPSVLTNRINERLKKWWNDFDKANSPNDNDGIYNKNPYLEYINEKNELLISVPEQIIKYPQSNKLKQPILVIKDKDNEVIKKIKLDLQVHKKDLLKTEFKKIKFPQNQKMISLEIIFKDEVILETEFERENFYFLQSNRVLSLNPLAYQELGLILKNNFKIEPQNIVMQKESLSGNFSEYSYYQLCMDDLEILNILNENGFVIETFKKTNYIEPQLIAGEISSNLKSKNKKVYLEKAPILLFTIKELTNLRLWQLRISINKGEKIVNINLRKLENQIKIKNKMVYIYLNNFFNYKYGLYEIRLRKRSSKHSMIKNIDFSFLVLPKFNIKYDKDVYPPVIKTEDYAEVKLKLPENYYFDYEDGEVVSKNQLLKIQFNPGIKLLNGYFISEIKDNEFKVSLSLIIPIIKWEIKSPQLNLTDQSRVKEIWHEDLYNQEEAQLVINNIDRFDFDNADLILNNDQQKIRSKKLGNKLIFDLMRFADDIKNSNNSVQEISLKTGNDNVYDLFKIRTKWEIINPSVKYRKEENIVKIGWQQLGRDHGKNIILWNKKSKEKIFSEEINNNNKLIVNLKKKILPNQYRLQFKEKDTWNSGEAKYPADNTLNVFDLTIGDKKDFIAVIKDKGLVITKVEDENGDKFPLNYDYKITEIRDASKLEFENEERYEGNLIICNKKDNNLQPEKLEYNPVSFYYKFENSVLSLFVDREKDGFTYCKKCQKLFWDTIDKNHSEYKHSKYHILAVRYYVDYNRISEELK